MSEPDDPLRWLDMGSPTLEDFEAVARAAFDRLPAEFRRLAGAIVIRIDEFPEDEVLDELGLESEFDLLGLYRGVGLPQQSVSDLPMEPPFVFLYRRPILDFWSESQDTLAAIIVHVLVHEIGHHFGLSDADMAAIEAEAGT